MIVGLEESVERAGAGVVRPVGPDVAPFPEGVRLNGATLTLVWGRRGWILVCLTPSPARLRQKMTALVQARALSVITAWMSMPWAATNACVRA